MYRSVTKYSSVDKIVLDRISWDASNKNLTCALDLLLQMFELRGLKQHSMDVLRSKNTLHLFQNAISH